MGTVYDDPNRECLGLDPAWIEGTGGQPGEVEAVEAHTEYEPDVDLDSMTKDELLAEAERRGVVANSAMTKAEIVEAIEAG